MLDDSNSTVLEMCCSVIVYIARRLQLAEYAIQMCLSVTEYMKHKQVFSVVDLGNKNNAYFSLTASLLFRCVV